MSAREFVIKKINDLILFFPNTKVRYEVREIGQAHIIEVLPVDTHTQNKDYMKFAMDFFFEFNKRFSEESLIFIDNDSLTEIENCELEIEGKDWVKSEIAGYLSQLRKSMINDLTQLDVLIDIRNIEINSKNILNKINLEKTTSEYPPFKIGELNAFTVSLSDNSPGKRAA